MAVWPDPGALEALHAVPRPTVPGVRWTRPEQWHVTLRFLGEADAAVVQAALGPPLAGCPAAEARMGPAWSLLGRNVLQVPVTGLEALAGVVESATAAIGRPPRPGPFHGHLTLARGRRPGDLRPLVGPAAPAVSATWPASEVTLVSSIPGRGGSRYEILETWRLR